MGVMTDKFFVIALNAVPWGVGPMTTLRKGGRVIPFMGKNQQLAAFQEAVKEELINGTMTQGEVELKFYIWRQLEELTVYGSRNRTVHQADATNMQKAIEDALQGVLIENDRNVRRISTEIVQQDNEATPCIVVHVKPYTGHAITLPDEVWYKIDKIAGDTTQPELPWDNPQHDVDSDIRDTIKKAEGAPYSGGTKVEDVF